MTSVLFWDIDGTLLTTARAGVLALERAVEDVLGLDGGLDDLVTAGMTDHGVAVAAIEHVGGEPDPETVDAFVRCYESHLPAYLPARAGAVLPGVEAILAHVDSLADVRSLLLTGNTPAGASAKLAHYGVERYFDGGAFCMGPGPREAIAEAALELVGDVDPHRIFVIGDTPADIRCGKAIGARTVAVAGTFSGAELAMHDPWLTLESLPEPQRFVELLGLS